MREFGNPDLRYLDIADQMYVDALEEEESYDVYKHEEESNLDHAGWEECVELLKED